MNNKTKQLDWRKERTVDTIAKDAKVVLSDDTFIAATELSEKADVSQIKKDIEEMKLYKFPNATIIGNPSISHGSVSGFSKTDYLHLTKAFNFNNDTFSIDLDFTTGSDVTTHQVLIGSTGSIELFLNGRQIGIKISANGTDWEATQWSAQNIISANTHYQVRVFWNKLQYTVEYKVYGSGDYTNAITFTLAQQPHAQTWNIGISNVNTQTGNPFKGTVNLNNWYVSSRGDIIWQGMDAAGLATRLATDLSNIDEEGKNKIKEIVNLPYYKEEIDKSVENVEKLKNDVETYIGAGKETVVVSITSFVEGVSVSDLTLYVYLNNAENPLEYTTDDHGMATFRVDVGYQYRVVFPYIPGCATIADVTHTAGVAQRSVEIEYRERTFNTEEFNLTVLKWTGSSFVRFAACNVHIKMDGVTSNYQTDSNGQFSIEIPIGKEYTVSFDQLEDLYLYGKKYVFNYVANSPRRDMMANYHDYEVGVFIVANDYTQYTKDEWLESGRPGSDAVLVRLSNAALVAGGNTFAINIDAIANNSYASRKLQWCPSQVAFNSIPDGASYLGLDRTTKIVNEGYERGLSTPAAKFCLDSSIEIHGMRIQGFLGAANQHLTVVTNENELNEILSIVRPDATHNFTNFIGVNKWTADQSTEYHAYYSNRSLHNSTGKTTTNVVEPFYAL